MVFWLLVYVCALAHDNDGPDCWTGGDGPRRT
jgi:hypothetical protein